MNCLNCNTITSNPKFCCRSCSATYTNKISPKVKKKQRYCKHCGQPINGRSTTCFDCNPNKVDWSTITLENMSEKRKYQKHSRIRELARQMFKKNTGLSCSVCGYDKHIEVCHIKPISSYPLNTPISVINNKKNIVLLCPNHHWELDNLQLPIH